MEILAKLIDINKIYRNMKNEENFALCNVNFNIEKGQFLAIVGESGSGKSTLMNILGCLDTPTDGEYILNNININKQKDKTLSAIRSQEIGFIFQSFNLIPSLTAFENVLLPLSFNKTTAKLKKQKKQEIALEVLERVGLNNRIHHLPSQMSGGQQQRVAIARAIATNPPIILADEPTGNLDSTCSKEIISILSELNNQGNTIVIITHDNHIAKKIPSTILIKNGVIIN